MSKICEICNKKIGFFSEKYSFGKYSILCSDCYQLKQNERELEMRKKLAEKMAKESEIKRKKIEEHNKLIEKCKTEYKNLFMLSYEIIYTLIYSYSGMIKYKFKISDNNMNDVFSIINSTIWEFITIENIQSITELDNLHKNEKLIKKIIYKVYNLDELIISYFDFFNDSSQINDVFSRINSKTIVDINTSYEEIVVYYETTINSLENNPNIDDKLTAYNATRLYFSYRLCIAICKIVINCKNIDLFIKHNDMYIIWNNLKKTGLNIHEILEKIYPIYKENYRNMFITSLSKNYILEIMLLVEERENYTDFDLNCNFKKWKITDESIFDYYKRNIFNYCTPETVIKYNNDVDYNVNISIIVKYVIKELTKLNIEHLNISDMVDIIYKSIEWEEYCCEMYSKYHIERERQRLLNGDIKKEQDYVMDKWDFNLINNGYEFEEYLKRLFEKLSYSVELTKKSKDQGGDLVIIKKGIRTVVQAKLYSQTVGNKAVQEVLAAKTYYNANNCMVVTNSTFTKSAIDLALANNIELINGVELEKLREKALNII